MEHMQEAMCQANELTLFDAGTQYDSEDIDVDSTDKTSSFHLCCKCGMPHKNSTELQEHI